MDFKTDSDRVAYNGYCVSVCRRENKTYFSDVKISDRTDNKTFFIKEKLLFPGKVNSLIKITLVENKEKILTETKITSEIRTVISYDKIVETFKNPFCEYFFNCYLAAPRPTLGHYRGDSLTHPMLITAYYIFDSGVTGSLVARLGPSARPCA